MIYITLDGRLFDNSNFSNLDKVSFTIRHKTRREVFNNKDDSESSFVNRFATSFSSEITAFGPAYDYIFSKIIAPDKDNDGIPDPGSGLSTKIEVRVYEDCCPDENGNPFLIFEGYIDTGSLQWCFNQCEVIFSITPENLDRSERCLKNKRIYDYETPFMGRPFYKYKHPFIWYCQEVRPAFLMDMLYATYIALLPLFYSIALIWRTVMAILIVIFAIIYVVNLLIELLTFGAVEPLGDFDFGEEVSAMWNKPYTVLQDIGKFIHGCKKGHPAPFVRDYLTHVCNACGIVFESSILNDSNSPYYNTVYLYAPVNDGAEEYVSWIDENKPLLTGEMLLEELARAFNADFALKDGGKKLVFERWDFFKKNLLNTEFIDARNGPQPNNDILSLCFSFPSTPLPAFARISYTLDGVDWAGNEAKKEYSDLVDWNLPFERYSHYKGEALYSIPYGPARFRHDGITRDPHEFWAEYARFFLLPVYVMFLIFLQFDPITAMLPDENRFGSALLLPLGLTTMPKLLIIYPRDLENAKVLKSPHTSKSGAWHYNMFMWVSAPLQQSELRGINTVQKVVPPINLYTRFFYIDDPRLSDFRGIEYELVIARNCKYLKDILSKEVFTKFVAIRIAGIDLRGRIDEVEIGYDKITIKGIV